ncbi:MAG: putative transcriptional regulator [Verrucomicrobiales bacterium]|jgi:putative transcriptional regulator
MTFDTPDSDDSLRGKVLLAAPSLTEATFRRTVLLLTNHHAKDGAIGYILNRPLEKTVSELLKKSDFTELADVPAYIGGPVSQEHLTFGSLGWNEADGKLQFETHLSAQEAVRHVKEGFSVRAFVGYSGWSEGQLEGELDQKAWVVKPPMRELVQEDRLDVGLWGKLIRDVSPIHRLAADMPDDPSLN